MNKKVLFFAMLVAAATAVQAKIRLPHMISDNMVIQQQTDVRLWGWAKAGKKVTATVSWSDQKVETKANKSELSFIISDTGKPFDPTAKAEVDITLSAEDRAIGGLGIHLIRQIMDHINYERVDGHNILTLIKKLGK